MSDPLPPLRVLVAIAEAYPFAKVGGLGDIGGALPVALAAQGLRVRLVLPSYASLGRAASVESFTVPMGAASEQVQVGYHGLYRGVEVYGVGNARFDRLRPYGYEDDDVAPFILWSKAVAALAASPRWRPDVVHAHDWHAALILQYLRRGPFAAALRGTRSVLTIHNLAYQGRLRATTRAMVGLRGASTLLARGIASADVVTTVSRRYREEILTPAGGFGLDRLLASRSLCLHAVVNGVDYDEFDPVHDRHIDMRYDGTFVLGKRANKALLQQRSGLPTDPDRPLLGMVSRLVDQKGIGLLVGGMDALVRAGAQVIVMGVGDERHENALAQAAARHRHAVAYHRTDDEALSRLLYAGSDLLLVPSVYEPFGLTPLIAMRYGTVPVVRRTGGMADTVIDCQQHPDSGTGLVFDRLSSQALVSAVTAGLGIRRDHERWQALQRRAMAVNFSWEGPAARYEQLYRRTPVPRPRDGTGRLVVTGPPKRPSMSAPVSMALVHHANQYVITDGYENREGLSELVDRYTDLLRLHERYGVVANLHLGGTLLQAILWQRPQFLSLVRGLYRDGLIDLIGGTYSENVMPLFPPSFNRRQLETALWLYERHLGCDPASIRVAWIPERVWDTALLAPVLTSTDLPNGGYRAVLLDDRVLDAGEDRTARDESLRRDIKAFGHPSRRQAEHWPSTCRPRRIAGTRGLLALPMSTECRYWLPPSLPEHWRSLDDHVNVLREHGPEETLLTYADDMEKTAGVGPWGHRDLKSFEELLRWLRARRDVQAVGLTEWIGGRAESVDEVSVNPGTFLELAVDLSAGEDYRGWADDPRWQPHQRHYERATAAVDRAGQGPADARLLALARDHLMASAYETAWHEPDGERVRPAPWARALASQSRASMVIAHAARWFARADRRCTAEVVDVDDDGEAEVVLRNEHLYAVISPAHGGRLVYLCVHGHHGGALVIGNPTDDWNWQEELNRYMDVPANHPGALTDVGGEHARYAVGRLDRGADAVVEMTCTDGPPGLLGARKSLRLAPGSSTLLVSYELTAQPAQLDVQAFLSPDYRNLLRLGREGMEQVRAGRRRGVRTGDVAVWLELAAGDPTHWVDPGASPAGHGELVQLHAAGASFSLVVGATGGTADEQRSHRRQHGTVSRRSRPPAQGAASRIVPTPLPSTTTPI